MKIELTSNELFYYNAGFKSGIGYLALTLRNKYPDIKEDIESCTNEILTKHCELIEKEARTK